MSVAVKVNLPLPEVAASNFGVDEADMVRYREEGTKHHKEHEKKRGEDCRIRVGVIVHHVDPALERYRHEAASH